MTTLALTVLVSSLMGSLHCAGMCGGLVAFSAGDAARAGGRGRLAAQLAYNAGRLASYVALGALAGAAGAALDLAGALAGIQRGAAVAAGALITLWGVATLLQLMGVAVPRLEGPTPLRAVVARGMRVVTRRPPAARALVLGLLTGCLPCGWLYAFVVTAAGTGGAATGAAFMAVFWLGTLPVMTTLGMGLQALAGPLRRHVPAACAVAMIVVGLIGVASRVRALDVSPASPPAVAPSAAAAPLPAPGARGSGHHGR